MQTADWLVGRALEHNTRILERLTRAAADDPRALLLDIQQTAETLWAYWIALRPVLGQERYRNMRAGLRALLAAVPEPRFDAEIAEELLRQDRDPRARAVLRKAMHDWPLPPADTSLDPRTRRLAERVFQQDSERWRNLPPVPVTTGLLLAEGVGRTYQKARRTHRRLLEHCAAADSDEGCLGCPAQVAASLRWARLLCVQLELLRPGLSESARTRLWYLARYHRQLVKARRLQGFADLLNLRGRAPVDGAWRAARRGPALVGGSGGTERTQLRNAVLAFGQSLDRRLDRLGRKAFRGGRKGFVAELRRDSGRQGLDATILVQEPAEGAAPVTAPRPLTGNRRGRLLKFG